MKSASVIKDEIAIKAKYGSWRLLVSHYSKLNGHGLLDKYENEAMEAYHAQFSQQPTEKTREFQERDLQKLSKEYSDEETEQAAYRDGFRKCYEMFVQSDSVDAKEFLKKFSPELSNDECYPVFVNIKGQEYSLAQLLTEFSGSKVKPVNDGWIPVEKAKLMNYKTYWICNKDGAVESGIWLENERIFDQEEWHYRLDEVTHISEIKKPVAPKSPR